MPKPTAPSRDEIKARLRAKVEAEKALPASERIANVLHATHSTADAQTLLARFRAEIRAEVAADFQLAARHQDEFSWGEAVDIARDGLCSCRGGNKPCPKAGAR
jgi:hypothetical protein